MVDFYKKTVPIIDDDDDSFAVPPPGAGMGLVPRNYSLSPREMFDPPSQMTIIPESEWDARYDEQEERASSLEHIYLSGPNGGLAFVNLDQDGHSFCWAYSTGHAVMILRLRDNQPLVRLNPHAVAAIIKAGRDEGGWCGLSAKFLREAGIPSEDFWPVHSRDLRNDTPAMRANAALHKVTEDWVDLTRPVHGQNLVTPAIATCGFMNIPVAQDFNWWSHSVCGIRWVRIESGNWGPLVLNSWKGWGRHGLAVLRGSKGICNGAVALRVTGASPI